MPKPEKRYIYQARYKGCEEAKRGEDTTLDGSVVYDDYIKACRGLKDAAQADWMRYIYDEHTHAEDGSKIYRIFTKASKAMKHCIGIVYESEVKK